MSFVSVIFSIFSLSQSSHLRSQSLVRPACDLPFHSVHIMETLVQNYRLDAQEQHMKQLQGDVAKIKTSLKLLEEELVESSEFRKVVLNWMHHQDSRSNFRSISQFPDSSSGSVSPPSSLLAQLEAFIARSEERLGKSLLHTGCGSKSRPESVNWALSTPENTFVHDRFEEASDDHGHLLRNIHSDSSFSGGSADPLFTSLSLLSSPSLCIQLKNIMSRCEENLCSHGRLMSHSVNGLLSDDLQGVLGSYTMVGCGEEQETIVGQDSPALGQLCVTILPACLGSNMVGTSLLEGKTRFRDVVLIPVPTILFPSVDLGLQWDSNSLGGVLTQSYVRFWDSGDVLLTVILFPQPLPLEKTVFVGTGGVYVQNWR
ncbi:hypothetical protein Hanom_Chr06g00574831 [Helianthus anomalus]